MNPPTPPHRSSPPSGRGAQPPDKPRRDYTPQRSDPLASLRLWGVDIFVAGATLTIPARPAVDWIEALFSDDVGSLLDEGGRRELDDFALSQLLPSDVHMVFLEALGEVTGRAWWVALRLCHLLHDDAVRAHTFMYVDVHTAPLARVLDIVYATVTQYMSDEQRERFEASLTADASAISSGDPREAARRARELSHQRVRELNDEPGQASETLSAATPPTAAR